MNQIYSALHTSLTLLTDAFIAILLLFCVSTAAQSSTIIGFTQAPAGDTSNIKLSGWACEKDNPNSITVSLYAGKTRQQAVLITSKLANGNSESAVDQRCNSQGDFRFTFEMTEADIFQNSGMNLYVEAQSQTQTKIINGRTQYTLPEFPQTNVIGFFDGVIQANGAYFAMGWACQTNVTEPVRIAVSVVDINGQPQTVVEQAETNVISESAISRVCRTGQSKHRFRTRIPESAIETYPNRPITITANASYGDNSYRLIQTRTLLVPNSLPTAATEQAPNVVFIFTDDQGFADLSVQQALDDVYTPNIDALANNGVRFTNGYITAPQCSPSRAAMLTGQYQQRFSMDENQHIPMTLAVETLAEKFQEANYATGMLGKWHLEIMNTSVEWGAQNYPDIVPFRAGLVPLEERMEYFPHNRGFDDMFAGYSGAYVRNIDSNAQPIEVENYQDNTFRVDLVNELSLSFVDKHWRKPFFLYLSPYAPHVPLEATQKYLDRFPEDMPNRRRYALAMMSAVDDGVGKLMEKLENYNLLDNTLIVFLSDNGAPLGDDMTDAPIFKGDPWNGSRNDPFTGEKGMLTEGALRVPFIMHWPNKISAGLEIDTPVSSLDVGFTALNEANSKALDNLDGLDLMPLLNGDTSAFDERPLFWRFYFQRAIRKGSWKYMQAGIKREYLFDMTQSSPEAVNLINSYPDIAATLRDEYWDWARTMPRPEPLVEIPKPFADRVDLYLPPPEP